MPSPFVTARLLTAYVFATASIAVHADAFVGLGTLNVITQDNVQVGCLNERMFQTTSDCAVFNGTAETIVAGPFTGVLRTISSSVGPCGLIEDSGDAYLNGENKILYCDTSISIDESVNQFGVGNLGGSGPAVLYAQVDDLYIFLPVNGSNGFLQEDTYLLKHDADGVNPGQVSISWRPQS